MERSKNSSWKLVGVRLSISLALIAFLIFIVDISSMKQALLSINMSSVFFIILVCFIQMILAGLRWFLIGRMTGPFLSAAHIFQINFGAMFSNQILPTSIGGDLIRIELSRQRGLSVGRATRTVILDRTTGLASLMLLLLSTGFIMRELLPPTWPVLTFQLLAAVFVAGSLTIIYYGADIEKRFSRFILSLIHI